MRSMGSIMEIWDASPPEGDTIDSKDTAAKTSNPSVKRSRAAWAGQPFFTVKNEKIWLSEPHLSIAKINRFLIAAATATGRDACFVLKKMPPGAKMPRLTAIAVERWFAKIDDGFKKALRSLPPLDRATSQSNLKKSTKLCVSASGEVIEFLGEKNNLPAADEEIDAVLTPRELTNNIERTYVIRGQFPLEAETQALFLESKNKKNDHRVQVVFRMQKRFERKFARIVDAKGFFESIKHRLADAESIFVSPDSFAEDAKAFVAAYVKERDAAEVAARDFQNDRVPVPTFTLFFAFAVVDALMNHRDFKFFKQSSSVRATIAARTEDVSLSLEKKTIRKSAEELVDHIIQSCLRPHKVFITTVRDRIEVLKETIITIENLPHFAELMHRKSGVKTVALSSCIDAVKDDRIAHFARRIRFETKHYSPLSRAEIENLAEYFVSRKEIEKFCFCLLALSTGLRPTEVWRLTMSVHKSTLDRYYNRDTYRILYHTGLIRKTSDAHAYRINDSSLGDEDDDFAVDLESPAASFLTHFILTRMPLATVGRVFASSGELRSTKGLEDVNQRRFRATAGAHLFACVYDEDPRNQRVTPWSVKTRLGHKNLSTSEDFYNNAKGSLPHNIVRYYQISSMKDRMINGVDLCRDQTPFDAFLLKLFVTSLMRHNMMSDSLWKQLTEDLREYLDSTTGYTSMNVILDVLKQTANFIDGVNHLRSDLQAATNESVKQLKSSLKAIEGGFERFDYDEARLAFEDEKKRIEDALNARQDASSRLIDNKKILKDTEHIIDLIESGSD